MGKRYIVVLGVVGLALAGYSLWWFDKADGLTYGVGSNLLRAMPENVELKFTVGEISGFPFRFVADVEDLELIIGGAGLDEGGRVQEGFAGRLDELRLSEGARYLRAFRPKRFFRADKKTRLLMRFDLVVDGAHPDSSAAAHKVKTVGEPKLAIVQD